MFYFVVIMKGCFILIMSEYCNAITLIFFNFFGHSNHQEVLRSVLN